MRGLADFDPVGEMQASDLAAPSLEFYKATGELLPYIESFYLYQNPAPLIEGAARVDLGQVRVFLSGEADLSFSDGRTEKAPPVSITGPAMVYSIYRLRGPARCFGFSLRGIGWKSLVGLSADKVADRILDGEMLFGAAGCAALVTELRGLTRLGAMVDAVYPYLRRRLQQTRAVPRSHATFLRILREWAASADPTLDALYTAMANETGMGQRQVQRLCKEYFAGPPNHLRRKFRAIWAAMRIHRGDSLAEVVGPFADQSHLINEIKHFTGHTPGTLRDSIDPVLAATLETESFHFLPDVIPETVDLTHG